MCMAPMLLPCSAVLRPFLLGPSLCGTEFAGVGSFAGAGDASTGPAEAKVFSVSSGKASGEQTKLSVVKMSGATEATGEEDEKHVVTVRANSQFAIADQYVIVLTTVGMDLNKHICQPISCSPRLLVCIRMSRCVPSSTVQ